MSGCAETIEYVRANGCLAGYFYAETESDEDDDDDDDEDDDESDDFDSKDYEWVRPRIIRRFLPCPQSTLWSFTPNDVDDTGPYDWESDDDESDEDALIIA